MTRLSQFPMREPLSMELNIPSEFLKQAKEQAFLQEVKEDVQRMREKFSFDDHMRIAFIPHVIIDTIWYYANQVQGYCRDHKIPQFIKLSRALNFVREEYYQTLQKDLSQEHIHQIHLKSDEWRKLNASDLTIMFFSMQNTLLKEYQSQEYLQCMSWAYLAMKLCKLGERFNQEVNDLIRSKLTYSKDAPTPIVLGKVYACMEAYLPDNFKVDDTQVDLCINIFRNNLNKLKFS